MGGSGLFPARMKPKVEIGLERQRKRAGKNRSVAERVNKRRLEELRLVRGRGISKEGLKS